MQTSIISKKPKDSLKSKGVVFKTILILSLFFISTFGTINDISVHKNDGNDCLQDFDTESLSVAADGIDNLVFSDDFNDGNYDGWIVDEGNWTVSNGYLRSKGWAQFWDFPNYKEFPGEIRRPLGSQMSFNNISLDFDFRYETPFFTGCRNQEIFIKFVINESKYFTLLIKEDGNYGQYGFFALQWFINGENSSLINKTFTPDNQWHSINMTIVDNKVSVLYDGTTQISQFLVSELGSLTFSDLSVKFTGWDDTVSDSYRNIDNITLKSSEAYTSFPNLVFSDDFNDFNYDGWIVDNGTWTVDNGYLRSKGWAQFWDYPNYKEFPGEIRRPLGSQMSFNNISLDFDFRYETPFFTGCRNQEIFIKFVINESKYFTLFIREDGNYGQYGFFALQWFINGENSSLINKTFTPDNQWHSINMTIVDNKVSVLYDGTTQISQFLVSELGSLTFSDLSVKFTGWDDTVSDSYRNIDNITLKSSRYIQQDVPSAPYLNAITSPSTTGNITLSWGAAPGATSYKIYRSNLPITSVTGLQPIKTGHTLLSYADVGLTNGTYYYVVVATNGSGDSEISNCRSVTVGIPENLILNADFSQTRNFSAFGHSVLVNNSFISPTVHNNKVFNSWNLHPEEGFERFYSFMGELKNLRTSLLELGLPSHFIDFLDFIISDDDSIRLLINLNVISNFSAKPIEELFFDLKDITDFFNKYFIDPNISLTIPDAIAPFLNDPRIDMWFDITSGAKSNKILQLKDNLEPIEAIINIVNMFFRVDISILTYRDNVVVPVTFRLSDLIESAQFAYNVLKLVGKIAALAAVGFVNPLGWVQTLATTYIIMHEFIFDPPWIVKAILNSIYTNLTDHINNTFYGFKSTSNWIYATAKFLDPPAARLDLALYNQQGNMILGYDKISKTSVQKSSAGFVLGDENAQFMVLYSDPGAKYDLKITNTALNGEGQTELDYQLLVYQPNSTQSNIFEGYLDLGEETSTKIVLPEKGQRFTFPQLDISLLKSEYPSIEIQILDENGNPVEVDTIKLYLDNVELEFDYKYLGNGKYQISNFALQENEQLIYQIVVSKAGYLMNSMRFSLFESQGNAATVPIIVAVILVSLMAVVVVLVRNRKKKTKIEQLASPKDDLDKFFDFDD